MFRIDPKTGCRTAAFLSIMLITAGNASLAGHSLSDFWNELRVLDFRGSSAKFAHALAEAPVDSPEREPLELGLAACLIQRQPDMKDDKLKAAAILNALIEKSSDPGLRAQAHLMLGRLAQLEDYFGDEPDIPLAVSHYQTLLEDYPDFPLLDLAALYRSQSRIFTMNPTQARQGIEEMQQWIEGRVSGRFTSLQWMLIAQAYASPLGEARNAVEAYRKALDAGLPPSTQKDALFWVIANLAEDADWPQVAIEFYTRIIREVPRSGYGFDAQGRIQDLGGDPPELINPFAPVKEAESEAGRASSR